MEGVTARLPRRSRRYGVGKEIGGAVYVHREYELLFGAAVQTAKRVLPAEFEYTVVKYVPRTGAVSFIHSPDFDTAPEPLVGDLWTVAVTGDSVFRRQASDPFVYHHKWLFVADDYIGFDIEESRERSRVWLAQVGLDFKRLGRSSYWKAIVSKLDALEE